jgi:hypothetical protein
VGWFHSAQVRMAGSCERDNEHFGFINDGKFLD